MAAFSIVILHVGQWPVSFPAYLLGVIGWLVVVGVTGLLVAGFFKAFAVIRSVADATGEPRES